MYLCQVMVRGLWVWAGTGASKAALERHIDACWGRRARRRYVSETAGDMV